METTTKMAETSASAEGTEQSPLLSAEVEKKLKVLVAIDDSEESFNALRWAIDNLFHGCVEYPQDQESDTITLINVQPIFQPFIYPAGPGVVYATPQVINAVKKAQQENAAAILSRALSICKEKKVKAETLILEGDPKDKICQAAEQLHVNLVVLGSRGLGTIKRALLGSVSNYCVHHAQCPVVIVKPPVKIAHE